MRRERGGGGDAGGEAEESEADRPDPSPTPAIVMAGRVSAIHAFKRGCQSKDVDPRNQSGGDGEGGGGGMGGGVGGRDGAEWVAGRRDGGGMGCVWVSLF